MSRFYFYLSGCLLLSSALNLAVTGQEASVDFADEVAPILSKHCLDCHGEEVQEGNLRLDRKASLLRGGDSGEPAIVPGNGSKSHLIRIVAGLDPTLQMPPDGDPLKPAQVELLRNWIDQGAAWPGPHGDSGTHEIDSKRGAIGYTTSEHWAFRPLGPVKVPHVDAAGSQNPIDAFIDQHLQENQLSRSLPAARSILLRRLYLDLLGVPPTPAAVNAFCDDRSPDAISEQIDRLLADYRYGQRAARHWLDLVRFAETHGFETNRERPHAWQYRDYVIESLNQDKPYDQFVREQLAGDAYGSRIGLGFLVGGPYDQVKSPDVNLTRMQRQNELDDIINTTSTVFLGLTVGCARCHNHKFDPIKQSDYYAMQAIFAGVHHGDSVLPLSSEQQARVEQLDQSIARVKQKLESYFRSPVSAEGNDERFEPHQAQYVRFTIEDTNGGEPCLDELAVYSQKTNVALASQGTTARASGTLPGYAIHRLEHINDGKPGNRHSWISDTAKSGWVELRFSKVLLIDAIHWARDSSGIYGDRLPTQYLIESSTDGDTWQPIASSEDRLPHDLQSLEIGTLPARFQKVSDSDLRQATSYYRQLQKLQQKRARLSQPELAYAGTYSQPGPTHRLYRGEPTAERERVAPNAPEFFADLGLSMEAAEVERRKALADWIASHQNPLTARVIVNRIWQFHFGEPIVGTPSDFGHSGVDPSHPQLLDWLAGELIRNNWSIKAIHRLILQSATYQQASTPRPNAMRVDSASRLLWRFPPRRLEAEPIRDSILAISGTLDLRVDGPGFSAFEVETENVRHYHPKKSYGPEDWRRMIYMTKVRMEQDSVFGLFDCPDAATSVPQRSSSTTPLQAFNLFNSSFVLQQAKRFAERLRREQPASVAAQINRAYQLCYARRPEADEQSAAVDFTQQYGLPAFCRALLNSNEFLFIP